MVRPRTPAGEPFAKVPLSILRDDELHPQLIVVYALLEYYAFTQAGGDGDWCDVSRSTLAGDRGLLSDDHVGELLTQLHNAGKLRREQIDGKTWRCHLPVGRHTPRLQPGGSTARPPDSSRGVPPDSSRGDPPTPAGGSGDSPNKGFRFGEREKERPPSPGKRRREDESTGPPLWAEKNRGEFAPELRRLMSEHQLAGMVEWREWFPEVAASFFTVKRWLKDDDPACALEWAVSLIRLGATAEEVDTALIELRLRPPMDGKEPIRFREQYHNHLLHKIKSQRASARRSEPGTQQADQCPAGSPGPGRLAWEKLTVAEREAIDSDIRREKGQEVGPVTLGSERYRRALEFVRAGRAEVQE